MVVSLLLLPSVSAIAPPGPPVFHAPYSGNYTASHLKILSGCAATGASLVNATFNLSTGIGRMGSRAASGCATGGFWSSAYAKQTLYLTLSTWKAVVASLHTAKFVLRATWAVNVSSTASSSHSGAALAELEIDPRIYDSTTGGSLGGTTAFVNQTHATGNNSTVATFTARISLSVTWKTTAGDSYIFVLIIQESAGASSGYPGTSGAASLDLGRGLHRIVVLSLTA